MVDLLSVLPTVVFDVFTALSLCTQGRFKYKALYLFPLFCWRWNLLSHITRRTQAAGVSKQSAKEILRPNLEKVTW